MRQQLMKKPTEPKQMGVLALRKWGYRCIYGSSTIAAFRSRECLRPARREGQVRAGPLPACPAQPPKLPAPWP